MKIRIDNEGGLPEGADQLLRALGDRRHVALRGAMGAGKTTLVGAIARLLGVTDDVASPTFSIINEYTTRGGEPVFHFDFYRIETPAQAFDLGLDDYFDSGALCLMEWAENVEALLPDDTVDVRISVEPDGSRILEIDAD